MLAVNITGIGILALFLAVILNKRNKQVADYFLLGTVLLFLISMASHIWISIELNPVNFALQNLSHYYLAPTFIWYALLISNGTQIVQRTWWWISSSAILFTLFTLVDFTLLNDYDAVSLQHLYDHGSPAYHVFYKGGFVFDVIALMWFSRRLKVSRHLAKQRALNGSIHLDWLHTFTWLLILANLISLGSFLLSNFGVINVVEVAFFIAYGAFTTSLFYFCYNGIKHYHLTEFHSYGPQVNKGEAPSITQAHHQEKRKYQSSSLKDEEMRKIFKCIKELFTKEELYSNPELKVYDLARQLNVTTHNISQTINSKADKTFYDFVNEYRVAHLKQLLTDPDMQHYTILGLGLESGFNSKTSLNRVFKQHTGMSPGTFRRMQLKAAWPV